MSQSLFGNMTTDEHTILASEMWLSRQLEVFEPRAYTRKHTPYDRISVQPRTRLRVQRRTAWKELLHLNSVIVITRWVVT